jgi:rubrerythrin
MDVEKAIKTALEYENKVWNVYTEAAGAARDEIGRRVFNTLAKEEKHHIEYLNSRLEIWQKEGKLQFGKLETTIPSKKTIESGLKKLRGHLKEIDRAAELQMLYRALDVEMETSNFYKSMVEQLNAEPQKMFARFLEIEQGHQALVKAEVDALTGYGVWFDAVEFDLEAE